MYKVFFNNSLLSLIESKEDLPASSKTIQHESNFNWKDVLHELKNQDGTAISIVSSSIKVLWESFCDQFKQIEAAGGLVKNSNDEILFIYRLNKWDLPKGKIEEGELAHNAAVREVEEECGIHNLNISGEAFFTYHTYNLGETKILKKTHWFQMDYQGYEELIPQTEEQISEVVWKNANDLKDVYENTYPSIMDVLDFYGIRNK